MRQKATEAVVFLCSALDRDASSKSAPVPVCWFTKGYSLDCATMRKISEHVQNECFRAGLHIPAVSFDGQWHNIAVRDDTEKPLTKLQLQKDVWRETESMKKQTILTKLKDLNKHTNWVTEYNSMKNIVTYHVTGQPNQRLPVLSERVAKQRMKEKKSKERKENAATGEDDTTENVTLNSDEKETEATQGINLDCDSNPKHDDSSQTQNIDITKATVILNMLKTDENCNKKGLWTNKTPEDIMEICKPVDKLKSLREIDLRVIVRFLKRTGYHKMKESETKSKKLHLLYEVLGLKIDENLLDNNNSRQRKKGIQKNVRSLKDLAYSEVSKLKKSDIVYAEYIWLDKLQNWQSNAFLSTTVLYREGHNETDATQHVDTDLFEDDGGGLQIDEEVDESENSVYDNDFFYIPAFSKDRQQYEVNCIDSSHLLTRTRRKCCKGGLSDCSNEPWKAVAKSSNTNLSVAMVDCIIDPMSVPTAVAHFSNSVEQEMILNGDIEGAKLCRDIRQWWRAEDEPGLSAKDRVKLRLGLRQRLLDYVDFGHFPPPGMHIHGWPSQLWEAIIANVDAKSLLYALSKQKSYNIRSFSSLVGETFFSELTLYDRRGQGTVTSTEFQGFIGMAVEKLHMRFEKERNFVYRTSRKTVYKLMDEKDISPCDAESVANEEIKLHDNLFDDKARARVKGRPKEEKISKCRNAVLRGSLGIRWEKARRNDSKIPPTVRMGISKN